VSASGKPELVLDTNSTSDPTRGSYQLSFFNGHCDTYMSHPLPIFEGESGLLLASPCGRAMWPASVSSCRC